MSEWSEEVRARLEELIAGVPPEWLSRNGADIQAALGEIERLRAWEDGGQQFLLERDELRKEVERLQAEVAWWQEQSDTGRQIREKERAEAEVERLREAYKSAEQTIRLGQKQVTAWKRGEKWCPRCEGTGATGAGVVCCDALAGEGRPAERYCPVGCGAHEDPGPWHQRGCARWREEGKP